MRLRATALRALRYNPIPRVRYNLDSLISRPAFAVCPLWKLFTDYTGPLFRVRRSLDQLELDIPAQGDGAANRAVIQAHCGSGDGFVTRVYDQSGFGRDCVQTTAGLQPIVCSAGLIILPFFFNGRYLRWLGTAFNSGGGALSANFAISKPTGLGGFNVCLDGGTAYSAACGYSNYKPAMMRARAAANDILDGKNISVTAVSDGSTTVPPLFINGAQVATETHNTNYFTGGITLGAAGNNTASMNVKCLESLVWKAQISAADIATLTQHQQSTFGGF